MYQLCNKLEHLSAAIASKRRTLLVRCSCFLKLTMCDAALA